MPHHLGLTVATFPLSPGEKIHDILDAAPAIIWAADPRTLRFTYVNRTAETILGYPIEQWTAEDDFWIDKLHRDDRAVVQACRRAIAARENHEFVYRMIAADGRVVWLRDIVKVRSTDDGAIELFGAMVDITAEREAHNALLRSEANYRRLVHASPDAIGVHDGVRYLYVNPAFVRLFGAKSESEIIGREIVSLIHPAYLPIVRERHERLARGESIPPIRQPVMRFDDGYAEAEVTAIPIEYNGIKAIQVVARDVTESSRTADRLELVAAGTSEAIWEVDFTDHSFWSNDAYQEMFGKPATLEEAFARGVETLHPEDREKTIARIVERLNGTVNSWSDEYRIRKLNSEYAWVLDRGRMIRDETGKPLRMIGAILDMTLLRQAEQAYRQIFEEVHDVIYTFDTEARITSLNPAFERLTGFRVEDWIGRSMGDILTPESRSRAFEHHLQSMQSVSVGTRQYQLHDAAGNVLDIEASAQPRVINGRVIGTIGVVRDVTERNRLQRHLEDAKRIASLGQLAASIAHEFNNVLMSIQPFAELLLRTAKESEHAEVASRHMTEAIARGKRVTSEILMYANPKDPQVEPVDAAAWLGAILISLRATLPSNIRLEALPAEAWILCDRYHLEQVVANLATNARDAMPRGGTLTIEISLDADEWRNRVTLQRSSRYARLTVRDTGTGISPSTMARLWEPLFTTKRSGTGLGLPIARRLIEQQNGAIFIETKEGAGTAFHIFLPLAPQPAAPHALPASTRHTSLERVLIVEDDEAVAAGLEMLFQLEGIRCLRVATGEEVAAAIADFRPQVVILDVHLPGMTGTDVWAEIRAAWPELPVIFSTGHLREMDLDPHTQIILKPYAFDELLEVLGRALGLTA